MARRLLLAAALIAALPATALPQAQTNLTSLRVSYNTRKATVKPQGALKTAIDEVDRQLAEATRLGRSAEIRRLLAKGQTLLAGGEWTDALDYSNSLVIRTEHVVADSTRPLPVRLEQIYSPASELPGPLTAHAVLRARPAPAAAGGATAPPAAIAKDLVTVDGVGRDLGDTPQTFELDVRDVLDGTYQLAIEVRSGDRALGTATLLVNLRKGLEETVAKLEADAKRAPEP